MLCRTAHHDETWSCAVRRSTVNLLRHVERVVTHENTIAGEDADDVGAVGSLGRAGVTACRRSSAMVMFSGEAIVIRPLTTPLSPTGPLT